MEEKREGINFFQKYLTLWVLICMGVGVFLGKVFPQMTSFVSGLQIEGISVPIAILIWIMIYPMMIKIDFESIKEVGKNPKGLFVTWITNWLIKPFTMFGISYLFFFIIFKNLIPEDLAKDYLAGAVLLGAAPCTAMVFVWSSLTKGDPAYTLVQVATNDLIILVAFIPIVKFLLGVSKVLVPYKTLFVSVLLFVAVPLLAGVITRKYLVGKRGSDYFEKEFVNKFDGITTLGLTILIFSIAYMACKVLGLPFKIAAPAGLIGASNFFELALAVAVALFGVGSAASLACTVGVLTEVPVMLFLVNVANKTKRKFA